VLRKRNLFPPTGTGPRAILYYVPFAPRPSLVVTKETLDKLEAVTVPPGALADLKRSLANDLVKYFGQPLILANPHLFPGLLARSLVPSTVLFVPFSLVIDPFFGCAAFFIYNFIYLMTMGSTVEIETTLSSRYQALCNNGNNE
jgi:hypothetical protein